MSDYPIVNLGDVENVAPGFQMPEGMDVRFPKRHLGCAVGAVGVEKLDRARRAPSGTWYRPCPTETRRSVLEPEF